MRVTHWLQMPLQQLAIVASGAAVDRNLFNQTTNIATYSLWMLSTSLLGGIALDCLDSSCDSLIVTAALGLINAIASIAICIVSSLKEGAEFFLITLSLGLVVGAARAALVPGEAKAKNE